MSVQLRGIDQATRNPPILTHSNLHMDKYLHGLHCGVVQGWGQSGHQGGG